MRQKPIFADHHPHGGFVKNAKIITIESDFGAGTKGAKLGPTALMKQLTQSYIGNLPITKIDAENLIDDEDKHEHAWHIDQILQIQKLAIEAIQTQLNEGSTCIIQSGDHSNGLAFISAYKDLYPDNNLGVIWIDAHADLHTPYTSPSGNMHGMPLGAALGIEKNSFAKNDVNKDTQQKWKQLIQLGKNKISPKLLPSNLVFIDIRDCEKEEIGIIEEHQILNFTPESRKELGIDLIIEKTLSHLSHCNHIYVSFDVDSLDPSISAGTGTPVHGGLSKEEAIKLLQAFLVQPNTIGFEITEINPLLDRHNPMEEVAAEIMNSCFN